MRGRWSAGSSLHHGVLDVVELVAEPLGHVADGVGELVDDRVEQRHRGREALAGFDGAAVDLDRMHRRAARADQQALAHHETQAHDGVGGLRDFLLQVGHHADDLVAEHVEAQVLVGPEQRFAREFRQPRVLRDPGAAARVGERQMHPGPADVIGERLLDVLVGDELGASVGLRNDRSRRCRIPAWRPRYRRGSVVMAGVLSLAFAVRASGCAAYDRTMTARG